MKEINPNRSLITIDINGPEKRKWQTLFKTQNPTICCLGKMCAKRKKVSDSLAVDEKDITKRNL